jgi:hypothetical protein
MQSLESAAIVRCGALPAILKTHNVMTWKFLWVELTWKQNKDKKKKAEQRGESF